MIFFFYGPNTFASRHKLGQLVDTYIKKTGGDLGLERLDGGAVTANQLSAALAAAPFLASSRLVVVSRLSENKSVSAAVPRLLGRVPESTVAVFYEGEVDQRTVYYKELTKQAQAVKFDQLTPAGLTAWVKREVARLGGSIDRAALTKLLALTGDDQWRLSQELNKLVNYQPEITLQTVEQLVAATPQQNIFDLVEAVTAGQLPEALRLFRAELAARTNELYILTMITWQLRNLLLVKLAGSRTPAELAKLAGISPYVAGKLMTKRRNYDEGSLRRALLAAAETDYAIKSGQGEAVILIEQLIYRIASA
jgi:DNA polymerase III subunit delta